MTDRGDRGFVLIAVLLAVAIMSVMVVAATSLTRAGISSQRLEARLLATELALRSGIETAKARILSTEAEQRVFFDGTPEILSPDGQVQVELRIRDAAGLIDLNRSEMTLLEATLSRSLDTGSAELMGRISQWRMQAEVPPQAEKPQQPGKGSTPPAQGGTAPAEGGEAMRSAPHPIFFLSVDQLRSMVPAEEARTLPGRFTVFSPKGLVNPVAAPREVLLAVPGLMPGDLARIDSARKSRSWKSDQGLIQLMERMAPFLAIDDATVFVISVRLVRGPDVIPNSEAEAVVLLTETEPSPFRTLAVIGL